MPHGCLDVFNGFPLSGRIARFWTTSINKADNLRFYRTLGFNSTSMGRGAKAGAHGYSVRCVKD
jgi:hypothetical protein